MVARAAVRKASALLSFASGASRKACKIIFASSIFPSNTNASARMNAHSDSSQPANNDKACAACPRHKRACARMATGASGDSSDASCNFQTRSDTSALRATEFKSSSDHCPWRIRMSRRSSGFSQGSFMAFTTAGETSTRAGTKSGCCAQTKEVINNAIANTNAEVFVFLVETFPTRALKNISSMKHFRARLCKDAHPCATPRR